MFLRGYFLKNQQYRIKTLYFTKAKEKSGYFIGIDYVLVKRNKKIEEKQEQKKSYYEEWRVIFN